MIAPSDSRSRCGPIAAPGETFGESASAGRGAVALANDDGVVVEFELHLGAGPDPERISELLGMVT